MPSFFSTPDDKSIPKGQISFLISSIFSKLIPPDKNHGLSICNFFIISQSNFFAFPPGNSFFLVYNQTKNNQHL